MTFLKFSSDPFEDMLRLQRALSRSLSRPFAGFEGAASGRGVFPGLNVFEKDGGEAIAVRAEVPGVNREDLNIEIQGNRLVVEGQRQIAVAEEGARYHRRERRGGEFRRIFRLPFEVDRESATAEYREGVLTIHMEKAEAAKPRQIAIKA
jgi:HSP20 family protein